MFEDAGVAPQRLIERLEVKTSAATTPRAQSFDDNALQVLKSAVAEADRRGDRHVGTEHIALALSRSNGTLASQALAELGFTPDRAEAALRKWIRLGMPRRRSDLERITLTSPILRGLLRPIRALTRYPRTTWNIFVRKSIGHPGFWKNPYPLYRKLRESEPIRLDPM